MSGWRQLFRRAERAHHGGDDLDAFRQSVDAWLSTGTPEVLREAIARATRLSVPEDVELEVERLQARLEALELGERLAIGDWPVVRTQHKAAGDDQCHEIAAVAVVGASRERPATLLVTSRRVVLVGTPLLQAPWSAVAGCRLEGRDLLLTFKGQTHRVRCPTHVAAERASVLGEALRTRTSPASP